MNRPTTQTCIDGTVYTFVEDIPALLCRKSGAIRELYFNGAAYGVLGWDTRVEVAYNTKMRRLYLVPENFDAPLAEFTGFEPMENRPHVLRAVASMAHISKMLSHLASIDQSLRDMLLPGKGVQGYRLGWACAIVAKGPDRPLYRYPLTVDMTKGVGFSHKGPLHPSRLATILALGGGDVRFNERTRTIAPCYNDPRMEEMAVHAAEVVDSMPDADASTGLPIPQAAPKMTPEGLAADRLAAAVADHIEDADWLRRHKEAAEVLGAALRGEPAPAVSDQTLATEALYRGEYDAELGTNDRYKSLLWRLLRGRDGPESRDLRRALEERLIAVRMGAILPSLARKGPDEKRVEDDMIDYATTPIDTPTGSWVIGAHAVDRYIERIRESCPTRERANVELATLLQLMPQPLPCNDGSGRVSSSWMLTDPDSGYERSITFCFLGNKLSTCYWTERGEEPGTPEPIPQPQPKSRNADIGTPLLSVYSAGHSPSYLSPESTKALRHAKAIDIVPHGDGTFILTPGSQVAMRYRSESNSGGANISVETIYGAFGHERPKGTRKYRLERSKGIDGLVFRPDTPLRAVATPRNTQTTQTTENTENTENIQTTREEEGTMTGSTPNGAHQAVPAEYSIVPIEQAESPGSFFDAQPTSFFLEIALARLGDTRALFVPATEHQAIMAAWTALEKQMTEYAVTIGMVLNYGKAPAPTPEAGTDDAPTEGASGA